MRVPKTNQQQMNVGVLTRQNKLFSPGNMTEQNYCGGVATE